MNAMWEDLKVYRQLDKKEINPTFKKFGKVLQSLLNGYAIDRTNSIIKLSRQKNQLEQAIFIAKDNGNYDLTVKTSIKPVDFYRRHKFTMLNIVSFGSITGNYRKSFYPLTQEWSDLAAFIAKCITSEIEQYFEKYDSYEKIIDKRNEIEPTNLGLDNKYELLIYAAIRTKNKSLLNRYLDEKIKRPVMSISYTEYLKSDNKEIDEMRFLHIIKAYALTGDFQSIEDKITSQNKP